MRTLLIVIAILIPVALLAWIGYKLWAIAVQAGTHPPKVHSLGTTLVLLFCLLCTAVLLVSNSLELTLGVFSQKAIVISEQQTVARETSAKIKTLFDYKVKTLQIADIAPTLNGTSTSAAHDALTLLLDNDQDFTDILLVTPTGQLVQNSSRGSSPQLPTDIEMSALLTQTAAGNQYVGPVQFEAVTHEPFVFIAVPVKNPQGENSMTIIARMDLKFLGGVVTDLQSSTGETVYIVDDTGALIASTNLSRVPMGNNLSGIRVVHDFKADSSQDNIVVENIALGMFGTPVVSTYASLGLPHWAVILETPVRVAYMPLVWYTLLALGIVLITFFIAAAIGMYLTKKVTAPIIELRNAVKKLADGDFDSKIVIHTKNEIGDLAEGFNGMSEKLKQSYAGLEKKVNERTIELNAKVAELSQMNNLMIDRELKMIELKKQIAQLEKKLESHNSDSQGQSMS